MMVKSSDDFAPTILMLGLQFRRSGVSPLPRAEEVNIAHKYLAMSPIHVYKGREGEKILTAISVA